MKPYKDAYVIVTGAGSGIGLELIRQLYPHTKHLLAVDFLSENLDRLREEFPCLQGLVLADLSKKEGDYITVGNMIKGFVTAEDLKSKCNMPGLLKGLLKEKSDALEKVVYNEIKKMDKNETNRTAPVMPPYQIGDTRYQINTITLQNEKCTAAQGYASCLC